MATTLSNTHPQVIRARRRACDLWRYASRAILSLTPIEDTTMPYMMGVDQHWRLYYNPALIEGKPIDEMAGVVLHEVMHLLLRHHKRGWKLLGDKPEPTSWKIWNLATDCTVNSSLRSESVKLPDGLVYPDRFGLPDDKPAEWYFAQLMNQAHGGGGSGSQDDPGGAQGEQGDLLVDGGGSCSDGQQRPWESGTPGEGEGVLGPVAQEQIIRDVAKQVEQAISQGRCRGGMKMLTEVLRPKLDPRVLFMNFLARAADRISGMGDYTYRRTNRRTFDQRLIRPSTAQPVPRVVFICDTSGSMGDKERALSCGLVANVLNRFHMRDGLKVICGDAAEQTVAKVFDAHQIDVRGGGGTDMGTLIEHAAQMTPRPELIVVCTDAVTPWPKADVGIPVIACVTANEYTQSWVNKIPSWIKHVVLE